MKNLTMGQRGFSAVEMVASLVIGSAVMVGTLSVITQLGQMSTDSRQLNLLNQTYFSGAQIVQNTLLMKALVDPNKVPGLVDCLGGRGNDCDKIPEAPKDVPSLGILGFNKTFSNNSLNADFDFEGPCTDDCFVRRTTQYQWICPEKNYCSGLRVFVEAAPLVRGPKGEMIKMSDAAAKGALASGRDSRGSRLADRKGDFILPARDFAAKRSLAMACGDSGKGAVALNFNAQSKDQQDTCTGFEAGKACTMPMKTFGETDNCQPKQAMGCTLGFSKAGIFDVNKDCLDAVNVAKTVKLDLECPGGGELQPDGECLYANRWCVLNSAVPGDIKGFNPADTGAVHHAGCWAEDNWYDPGVVYRFNNGTGGYGICMTGPKDQFPLPEDPYCKPSQPKPPSAGNWVGVQSPIWTGTETVSMCADRGIYPVGPCAPVGDTCGWPNCANIMGGGGCSFMTYTCQ